MIAQQTRKIFSMFVLTFAVGSFLVFRNFYITGLYTLIYILAFYFLSRMSIEEDFFTSSEKNRFDVVTPELVVMGQNVLTENREEQQEDRFLNHFEFKKVAKRSILSISYLIVSIFLIFFKGNQEISTTAVIPIICGFLCIKSVYVGHLLVPLAINIYSTVYHFQTESSITIYGLYIFLIFLTLKYMSEASGKFIKLGKVISLLPMAFLFLATIYGTTFLFPKSMLENESKEMSKLEPTRQMLQSVRTQNSKMLQDLKALSSPNLENEVESNLKEIDLLAESLSSKSILRENPEVVKEKLKKILQSTNELQKDVIDRQKKMVSEKTNPETIDDLKERFNGPYDEKLEKLKESIQKNQELITSMQNVKSDASGKPANLKELEHVRDELKNEFSKMTELSPSERLDIQTLVQNSDKDLEVLKNLGADTQKIEALTKNLQDLKGLAEKQHHSQEELKQISSNLNIAQEISELKRDTKERIQNSTESVSLEDERDEAMKVFEKKSDFSFQKLVPLLVLIGVFVIINYFMRKKGIKKVETLEEEIMEDLVREHKKILRLKLSPREEVIHYYNLFHNIVQRVHYSEYETPPSCIVFHDMKKFSPKLNEATFQVTETYTMCFYGNKEVSLPSLKSFRKSIQMIFRVYGLA